MHDPMTVAHEIKYPWKDKPSKFWPKGYRHSLITIWHVDPEKDGSDDSCGWFKRARHGDKAKLAAIESAFRYECNSEFGWFDKDGKPKYTSISITIGMFRRAAYIFFDDNWRKTDRFMKRHLYEIIQFGESPVDSIHSSITMRYGFEEMEDRVKGFAQIVYGCLLRWNLPWWRHPRWHIHHWKIQIHPWQQFRRWAFERCSKCGGRYSWGYSPCSGWSGGKTWHHDCDAPQSTGISSARVVEN
jgi:hypothetical protein